MGQLVALLILLAGPAVAGGLVIQDPAARIIAGSGVEFFRVENQTDMRVDNARRTGPGMGPMPHDAAPAP